MGYGLQLADFEPRSPGAFFWYGAGGSMVMNDIENRMTATFVMNQMLPALTMTERTNVILDAVYESLA